MGTTSDLRKGLTIEVDGNIYRVVDFLHVKPGKGQAFVRTKLKNVETGAVIEKTFKIGVEINIVSVEEKEAQYLYNDGANYYFMDLETYEQYSLPKEKLEEELLYLKEGINVNILLSEKGPIGIELPNFVELEVVETDPGVRGDTASGGSKPAKLETGLVIQVPLFINEGDKVKVDTRTGKYIERV